MPDERDDEMPFFEIAAFKSPLERLRENAVAGEEAQEMLAAAERLARGGGAQAPAAGAAGAEDALLEAERERFRREDIDPGTIDELVELSAQVGEESFAEQHALLELVQAAAVGNSALLARNLCTVRLAMAAKRHDRIDRARLAYTDVFSDLQILGRLFQGNEVGRARAEESARQGWAEVQARSPGGLDVFDAEGDDPAPAWESLIRWHSDLGSGQGLIAQADATLRLALHFEHWVDRRGRALQPAVDRLIDRCAIAEEPPDEDGGGTPSESILAARFLVTVGDALIEVGQWELAAVAHARALPPEADVWHPVYIHATAQEAWARLMAGDAAGCRRALERLDPDRLDRLADRILTVAAGAARCVAVRALADGRDGRGRAADARTAAAEHLRRVALIVRPRPASRLEYLRTLYFAMTARDVETMLEG